MLSYAPRWKQAIQSCRNIPWFRPQNQCQDSVFPTIDRLPNPRIFFKHHALIYRVPNSTFSGKCFTPADGVGWIVRALHFRSVRPEVCCSSEVFLTNLRTPSPHSASVMNDPASWAILIPLLLLLWWLLLLLLWSWDV